MTVTAPNGSPDPREVARQLGMLLDAVDRGDVEATDLERAYLAGATDTLAVVGLERPAPLLDQAQE